MLDEYSAGIGGFGLSDSADGPVSAINHDEVQIDKFLHIFIGANVPGGVTTLQAKFRKVTGSGTGNPQDDRDFGTAKKVRDGQFELVVMHFLLDASATWFIRVADDFVNDTKCLASAFAITRPYPLERAG